MKNRYFLKNKCFFKQKNINHHQKNGWILGGSIFSLFFD
jgi:hypothetical protein